MPFTKDTGIPVHPAIKPDKISGGRLLPINHPAWENVPFWDINTDGPLLAPQLVDKHKRNGSQPVSTVGFFALYASDKNMAQRSKYIGQGAFGKVKFAQRQDGKWFAVKTIAAPKANADEIRAEATMLYKTGKLEAFYQRTTPNRHGWNVYYLIQEWIDGEVLEKYYHIIRTLPLENKIAEAMRFIAAINTVNQQDITHNDVSPNNVIRKHDGHYELIDFGRAHSEDHTFQIFDLKVGLLFLIRFFTEDEYHFLVEKHNEYLSKKPVHCHSEVFKAIHVAFDALKQSPYKTSFRAKL